MNLSFLATILFALLAIGALFVANLVVLVFTTSQWHVSGALLAIASAAASYWAQAKFTMARISREAIEQTVHQVNREALALAADKAEGIGTIFQFTAIGLAAGAAACFWIGMAPK